MFGALMRRDQTHCLTLVLFTIGFLEAVTHTPRIEARQATQPQGTAQPAAARPPDPARSRIGPAAEYKAPERSAFSTVAIRSEGVRLHGEIFALRTLAGPLPTILMAHGWGGTAAVFRADAVDFARAGYLVVVFDYRGWGESDSRVILTGP